MSLQLALVPQFRLRLALLADLWLRVQLLIVFLVKVDSIIRLLIIILQIGKLLVRLIELRVIRFLLVTLNVLQLLQNDLVLLAGALVKAFAEVVADDDYALRLVMDVPVVDRPVRVDNVEADVLPGLEDLLTTEVEPAAAVDEEQGPEEAALVRVGQFVEFLSDDAI